MSEQTTVAGITEDKARNQFDKARSARRDALRALHVAEAVERAAKIRLHASRCRVGDTAASTIHDALRQAEAEVAKLKAAA